MNKKCGIIITLLVALLIGGGYKFIIQGSTSQSTDGRTIIHLNASERDLVLEEMRAFLDSVQHITQAVAENNPQKIAEYAKKVGKAAQGAVPGTLMGKLPIAFKKLGFSTHTKFDQLALDIESLGDTSYALGQLSELMQNCVSCHATYRLEIEK